MVRLRVQAVVTSASCEQVTLTWPHSLCAVTAGAVAHVGMLAGLQLKAVPAVQLSNAGAVATDQVYVREHVLVRPQDVALYRMVRLRVQPGVTSASCEQVTVTEPHSLCAVTDGAVAHVGMLAGLQPRSVPAVQLSKEGAVATDQV